MTVYCLWCEHEIATANPRHPGYCSPSCRDTARANTREKHRRARRRKDDE